MVAQSKGNLKIDTSRQHGLKDAQRRAMATTEQERQKSQQIAKEVMSVVDETGTAETAGLKPEGNLNDEELREMLKLLTQQKQRIELLQGSIADSARQLIVMETELN